MGRWLKSVDCWVLLCEGLQSRSTTTLLAERLRRADNTVSCQHTLSATPDPHTNIHPSPFDARAATSWRSSRVRLRSLHPSYRYRRGLTPCHPPSTDLVVHKVLPPPLAHVPPP
eukprot:scaffold17551_cov140-Isochrysis_galbana.AAC.1